jgi:hypothetical protein
VNLILLPYTTDDERLLRDKLQLAKAQACSSTKFINPELHNQTPSSKQLIVKFIALKAISFGLLVLNPRVRTNHGRQAFVGPNFVDVNN